MSVVPTKMMINDSYPVVEVQYMGFIELPM